MPSPFFRRPARVRRITLQTLVLSSLLLAGCGNKGELFLPGTIEDERVLQDIDQALDGATGSPDDRERRRRRVDEADETDAPVPGDAS